MTLTEILTASASIHGRTLSDLTINGQNLGLEALNAVRRAAEEQFDFEFSRKLATVAVNGVTGGNLATAVTYGTTTAVDVSTVIEVGVFDEKNNLRPVEWTTVAEGLERSRSDNAEVMPRYPADGWFIERPYGLARFTFSGDAVYAWPKDETHNFVLGLECYTFRADWPDLAGDAVVSGGTGVTGRNGAYVQVGQYNGRPLFLRTASSVTYAIWYLNGVWQLTVATDIGIAGATNKDSLTSMGVTPSGTYAGAGTFTGTATVVIATRPDDPWTTRGAQYLKWAVVAELNPIFKTFVNRTEGNVGEASIETKVQSALLRLKEWDTMKYEQLRRHGR